MEISVGFQIISRLRSVKVIANGKGIRILKILVRRHGKGRWRKMKGKATIKLASGAVVEAEIHWYEAHGFGRKDFKIKCFLG